MLTSSSRNTRLLSESPAVTPRRNPSLRICLHAEAAIPARRHQYVVAGTQIYADSWLEAVLKGDGPNGRDTPFADDLSQPVPRNW
jgi:hypothetical protein